MQVKELTVRRMVKINLGNYENTDVGVSLTTVIEEGESVETVHMATSELLRSMLFYELMHALDHKRARAVADSLKLT